MGSARFIPVAVIALSATVGAPLNAQRDTAVAPGTRVRVWVGTPTRLEWRAGRLLAMTGDSLLMERTDVLGQPRLALPLDSVRRLDVYRSRGRARTRAVATGCLAGGVAVGFLGLQVRDPDSPGLERYAALVGAGYGCSVGALVGALVSWGSEWRRVPMVRAGAATPPPPRTPPPPA